MSKKQKNQTEENNEKNAGNNQWTNANVEAAKHDKRDRRDGPGGEDAAAK